ncbi:RNA-directed DNA polymerase, eukaryota, reverse transcriptase zinc-binding domain protein [Tanacetum coccineum]
MRMQPSFNVTKEWSHEMVNYFKRPWEADREKEKDISFDAIEGIVKDVLEDEFEAIKNLVADEVNGVGSMDKRAHWKDLILAKHCTNGNPWVIMSDFNITFKIEKHYAGKSTISNDMQEFLDCVNNIRVEDLCMSGMFYTWIKSPSSPNTSILKKLDRVMANDEFTSNIKCMNFNGLVSFSFLLPKSTVKDIERVLKGFLWCQRDLARGKAKIAWKTLCKQGGLGFKDLGLWNEVLLTKNVWNIVAHKERDKAIKHIEIKVGNGKRTYVWYDKWNDVGPLSQVTSRRDIYDARFENNATLSHMIVTNHMGFLPSQDGKFRVNGMVAINLYGCGVSGRNSSKVGGDQERRSVKDLCDIMMDTVKLRLLSLKVKSSSNVKQDRMGILKGVCSLSYDACPSLPPGLFREDVASELVYGG